VVHQSEQGSSKVKQGAGGLWCGCTGVAMASSSFSSGRGPSQRLQGHALASAQDSVDRERVYAESINREGNILHHSQALRARNTSRQITTICTTFAVVYTIVNLATLDLTGGGGTAGNVWVLTLSPAAYAITIPAIRLLEQAGKVDQFGPTLLIVHSAYMIILPVISLWARGSFVNCASVIVLSVGAPVSMVAGQFNDTYSWIVFVAFAVAVVVTAVCEAAGVIAAVSYPGLPISEPLRPFMFAVGILGVGIVYFIMLKVTVKAHLRAQERNTALIYSIFPPLIADEILLASLLQSGMEEKETLVGTFSLFAKDSAIEGTRKTSARMLQVDTQDLEDEDASIHRGRASAGAGGRPTLQASTIEAWEDDGASVPVNETDSSQVADSGTLHVVHEQGTIIVAEIVDYLQLCQRFSPRVIMRVLDEAFSKMDEIGTEDAVLKVRTMGDTYMAATGLMCALGNTEDNNESQGQRAVKFCLNVLEESSMWRLPDGSPIQLRMGLSSGPLSSGVIGHLHPQYEVFGEIPVLATLLCRSAQPGTINMDEGAYSNLERSDIRDGYEIEQIDQTELVDVRGRPLNVLRMAVEDGRPGGRAGADDSV